MLKYNIKRNILVDYDSQNGILHKQNGVPSDKTPTTTIIIYIFINNNNNI